MRLRKTTVQVVFVLCFCMLPISTLAQCTDQQCQDLQNILDAAVIDFRAYAADKSGGPELAISGTKFDCQTQAWANNVPMYMCYAQVPSSNGQSSYGSILDDLKRLRPAWNFRINSPNEDHYVDAGPPDCDIPPNDGPYIGNCPLHLQAVKQKDGTMRLHFWMNSLSSPYLVRRPPAPQVAPRTATGRCDDFCQNFMTAFVARRNSFAEIRGSKTNDARSDSAVKLEGAKECVIEKAVRPASHEAGMQFVCYWAESSGAAAETRFRDLIARVQGLVPPNWSKEQENETDENTGAKITKWHADEPGGKHDVRIYFSGEAVGLHITSWN